MVGIISSGIGSGLDIQGLVQQLVAAEGQTSSQRLLIREANFQSELSALGSLKSALDELKTAAERLGEGEVTATRTASSSDDELLTVNADTSAASGEYDIEILSLATNARLTSGVFAGSDTAVGTGTLTLSLGSEAFSVSIDSENNSLAAIRDAINAANDNTGIEASIINADGGAVIILSGTDTGDDAAISISQTGGDGGLAALTFDPAAGSNPLTQSQAAEDASIRVNGLDVSSATNTFTDVIDGVTLIALQGSTGQTVQVGVSNDTQAVKGALATFTVAYNAFVDTINQLSSFDPESNEAGPLQGDSTLRSAVNLLRRELSTTTASSDSALDTLTEIGISLDENGKLITDEAQLDAVLQDNFRAIQNLFGADDGYVSRITSVIDSFTGSDGVIETRTDGLQSSIDGIALQNEALNQRLVSLEARLLRQFNGLDSLLAQLNNTSNFLAAQLANVPTPGGSNSA